MATKTIPWNTGTGNITLTYTGQGNDTVTVASDPNDVYEDRYMAITIQASTHPSLQEKVDIVQGMKQPNFKTADNYWILTADNKYFNVQEEQ